MPQPSSEITNERRFRQPPTYNRSIEEENKKAKIEKKTPIAIKELKRLMVFEKDKLFICKKHPNKIFIKTTRYILIITPKRIISFNIFNCTKNFQLKFRSAQHNIKIKTKNVL